MGRHSVRAGLGYGEGGAQRTGVPYHRKCVAPIRVQSLEVFAAHEPYKRVRGRSW